ncbi:hypothetical protein [Neolewinella persica]|uniref:hypothetical protein n=1 Tax=Neolewinella persica TaxID=70998 RepID=UPI000379D629|nr:hypothetical protein [Neolewinella persica]
MKARKATGYFKGLKVESPEISSRFTPASLSKLTLVNTPGHTICNDIDLRITQQIYRNGPEPAENP